jgi:uncharacterized protein
MSQPTTVGAISWIDLTVPNATAVKDFYRAVVGWTESAVSMGDHVDYCVHPPGSPAPVAGICHAKGQNVGFPAQWLLYITVADLDRSMTQCVEKGGKVVRPAASLGGQGRFCIVQDPAGAVAALFEPAPEKPTKS